MTAAELMERMTVAEMDQWVALFEVENAEAAQAAAAARNRADLHRSARRR